MRHWRSGCCCSTRSTRRSMRWSAVVCRDGLARRWRSASTLGHDRRRRVCAAGRGDDGHQRAAGRRAPCRRRSWNVGRETQPGPLEKVEQAAEELAKTDASKPPPGVVPCAGRGAAPDGDELLWSGSMGAVAALNQLIMILFLTYFILLSDKMFRRKFVELAGPTLTKKKITVEIIDSISSQIGRFLARADLHERRRRRRRRGRRSQHSASSRPRSGACSRASSIPFRTTARSSSAAGWRSSRFCSSARST